MTNEEKEKEDEKKRIIKYSNKTMYYEFYEIIAIRIRDNSRYKK